jgi:hypothetical protein
MCLFVALICFVSKKFKFVEDFVSIFQFKFLFCLRKLNLKIQCCYNKNVCSIFHLYFLTRVHEKIEKEEKGTTVFVEIFNLSVFEDFF